MSPESNFSIAVLISGGGTTLKNLIEYSEAGRLGAEIGLVISSSSNAKGLKFAESAKIPTVVVKRGDHPTAESFSNAVFSPIRNRQIDLVVMGGFLKHVLIPQDFENRVINIHPSLIPSFSGKGFYGSRVHQAVLDYGAQVSGCTVHFVDNEFDHGPIILQETVPVEPNDTVDALAARIFRQECLVYPHAINLIAKGCVAVADRNVVVTRSESTGGRD